MSTVQFELQKVVNAPIQQVFDRLADIVGHNEWMPKKGSLLKETKVTSPGPIGVGTTYLDDTSVGATPGDIAEFEPPTRLVYHWWDKTKSGKTKYEGWPGYRLEDQGDGTTLVRHDAKMQAYGVYVLMTPMFKMMAKKERGTVLEALAKSFE